MKLLTLARDLQRRKGRERQGCFVAEGIRTVEALFDSVIAPNGLLITPEVREQERGRSIVARAESMSVPIVEVSVDEFASAASTESPQGVLAVAPIPSHELAPLVAATARYLLLDALQDPGNVGTIVRTAAALGVDATVALPGTVDFWNAKVVRSAMGALFVHPVLSLPWEAVDQFLSANRVACWAADTGGIDVRAVEAARDTLLPDRLALVVSNEGAGLSPHIGAAVTQRIGISMTPGVESLNVAVATGILLHALRISHAPLSRHS